jgi:glycosyltransferase involved in cell wall biosynthesis
VKEKAGARYPVSFNRVNSCHQGDALVELHHSNMTIIGVVCVKNEEDIIEAFVRHNLFYLQKLIVLNHGSTDKTSAILSRLVAEGLHLVVEDDPSLGKFQGEKMTRLMQRAVNEHGADWVLLLDGDELIRCPSDRLSLPENPTGFLKVAARTYQVRQSDDSSVINPAERIHHRLDSEPLEATGTLEQRRYLLKAIVPRALAATPGACVVQGNHYILIANQEPANALWSGFDYAHFSLRTVGHYASKIAIGTLQHAYHSSARANIDSFYLAHLEELKTDFEGFSRRFYERIPSYLELVPNFTPVVIHDPLRYRGGPLRYTSTASDYTRLVANLINYAGVLAKAAAPHASSTRETVNQIEELAVLDFFAKESAVVATHKISSSSNHPQTILFPLGTSPDSATWNLRITSPEAIVEVMKVRWLGEQPEDELEMNGGNFRSKIFPVRDALSIPHDQYAAFIKGSASAVIGLSAPPASLRRRIKAVEIQIQIETDATRIGVRLLQNNNLNRLLSSSERVQQLDRKLAERTTLPGACGFQIYRLWRATSRLFQGKPANGRKISQIYVATCRRDWHLAQLCLASIRYWYPDFPVCLIKDGNQGDFDTSAAEKRYKVTVLPAKAYNCGYGFSKLEPLFFRRKHRYLMLDADLLILGPVLELFNQSKADFVVHPENNGVAHTETLAYKLAPLAALDPHYQPPDFIFNSGNYVATSGLLKRADFDGLIRWQQPRQLKQPDIFMCGDQGVLNYVLLKAWKKGRISLDLRQYYRWGGNRAPDVTVADIRARKTAPLLIHWAGPKSDNISEMPRADLLQFFKDYDAGRTEAAQ